MAQARTGQVLHPRLARFDQYISSLYLISKVHARLALLMEPLKKKQQNKLFEIKIIN